MRSAEEEEVPEEFDRPSVTISLLTPPLLLAPNGAEVGGRRRPLAGHSRSVRQKMKESALDKVPHPSTSHTPPRVSIFVGGGGDRRWCGPFSRLHFSRSRCQSGPKVAEVRRSGKKKKVEEERQEGRGGS